MSNQVIVDKGALQMALNVLERAGKNEVADELRNACSEYAATLEQQAEWPSDADVLRKARAAYVERAVYENYPERDREPITSCLKAALQSVRPPIVTVPDEVVAWFDSKTASRHARKVPDDTRRLDILQQESWDLRCFEHTDGEDVGWRVIDHYMQPPQERVLAHVYKDDPRAAIDAAIESYFTAAPPAPEKD